MIVATIKKDLLISFSRHNANSRYREGDPILHVKEIVDSPLYGRRKNAPIRHIYLRNDKFGSETPHLADIGDVKHDIYRDSKKNFMDRGKGTTGGYKYYDARKK